MAQRSMLEMFRKIELVVYRNGGDVIVTAQKRSENIQGVLIAVTAATADALNDRNLFDTTKLPQVVPRLQVSGINN